jgi:hypothetical protein
MIYLSHEVHNFYEEVKLLIQKDDETPCYWIAQSFTDLREVLSEISNYITYEKVYNATFINTVTKRSQRFVISHYDEVVLSEELKLWILTTFWEKNFPSFTYNFKSTIIHTPDLLEGL